MFLLQKPASLPRRHGCEGMNDGWGGRAADDGGGLASVRRRSACRGTRASGRADRAPCRSLPPGGCADGGLGHAGAPAGIPAVGRQHGGLAGAARGGSDDAPAAAEPPRPLDARTARRPCAALARGGDRGALGHRGPRGSGLSRPGELRPRAPQPPRTARRPVRRAGHSARHAHPRDPALRGGVGSRHRARAGGGGGGCLPHQLRP